VPVHGRESLAQQGELLSCGGTEPPAPVAWVLQRGGKKGWDAGEAPDDRRVANSGRGGSAMNSAELNKKMENNSW
jgi:hypothetical protein